MKKFESSIGLHFVTPKGTLQDIYDWLQKVEYFNIPRSHPISDVDLSIYIDIPFDGITSIECGDHLSDDPHYDILIELHSHKLI